MTRHDAPDDLEIARAQRLDSVALNSVLEKSSPYILALCKRWCRPPIEATDIAQESLVRVAKTITSYKGESAFFSWVYTLTYRTFLDQARKNKRRDSIVHIEALDNNSENKMVNSDDAVSSSEQVTAGVSRALEALESIHRDILILVDVQELSYEEIARSLDLPIGTVRSRIARARLNFKKNLIEQGTFGPSGDVLPPEEQL